MKLRNIEILEADKNKKGDLFCRLMGDLFHVLGYDEPRFNIHKSGRELDLTANHRTERKIAVAECKAHEDTIGGSDINKFVGVLDAEIRKVKKSKEYSNYEVIGYFVSLSGFKETTIEQEEALDNDRLILIKPGKLVGELIAGKIIVPIESAISCVPNPQSELALANIIDLYAYNKGWVWVIYYSSGQTVTHFALIHAEGKPLIKDLANEIIELDKNINGKLSGLTCMFPVDDKINFQVKVEEAKKRYFKYIENECGEIQFEGLPTDKDAGSVKVKLESIFVPLHLEEIKETKEDLSASDVKEKEREEIGNVLKKQNRIAILAKPGGGKSTLVKRLAVAYAYPERREQVKDNLPEYPWFPIFIRCRELGEKVTASITDIINNIPNRAEISFCCDGFSVLVSDALQKGNALLLIDGLDEIADDKNRIAFVNQLRTFLATFPNINIIATSREAGFRVVGGSLSNYCSHYKLTSLNASEIEDLTIRWHKAIIDHSENTIKEAKLLSKLILKDNRIRVLAENPLLLTTLLFVKRWAGYLPTKKSVLYQEMIKLLLVTWNVEGHEQLDIDEAEPQLAFVAFWMTSKGKQTVTVDELKECLISARKQMPDILGYTKISVSDFIKRVESRSSLLIMTGHKKLDTGQITPIYEFLHLSFQEYLTAKAIVERHLPKKEAKKTILAILKPHIENETWKEIFPLVAVVSKRETKELIEYLIAESKQMAVEYRGGQRKSPRIKKISPPELLGNCIASEIQINPALLENALEWYAKCYPTGYDKGATEIILNGKFGDLFRNKVKTCFFEKYDDQFAVALGSLLGEIYLIDLNTDDFNVILPVIKDAIRSASKEEKCTAILALMELAFEVSVRRDRHGINEPKTSMAETLEVFLGLLKSDDLHYHLATCWCLVWLESADMFSDELRTDFVNIILDRWLNQNQYNLCRLSSWALSLIMRPSINIDSFINNKSYIKEIITEKYKGAQNEYDRIVAVYVGSHINLIWDKAELRNLFLETLERSHRHPGNIRLYADKLGIDLSKGEVDKNKEKGKGDGSI